VVQHASRRNLIQIKRPDVGSDEGALGKRLVAHDQIDDFPTFDIDMPGFGAMTMVRLPDEGGTGLLNRSVRACAMVENMIMNIDRTHAHSEITVLALIFALLTHRKIS